MPTIFMDFLHDRPPFLTRNLTRRWLDCDVSCKGGEQVPDIISIALFLATFATLYGIHRYFDRT